MHCYIKISQCPLLPYSVHLFFLGPEERRKSSSRRRTRTTWTTWRRRSTNNLPQADNRLPSLRRQPSKHTAKDHTPLLMWSLIEADVFCNLLGSNPYYFDELAIGNSLRRGQLGISTREGILILTKKYFERYFTRIFCFTLI